MKCVLCLACVALLIAPPLQAEEPKLRSTLSVDFGEGGHTLAFSPDGKILVCADKTLDLWDVASGKRIATLQGGEDDGPFGCVAIKPDGINLASAGRHGITLWDVSTRVTTTTIAAVFSMRGPISFSADGTTLASVSRTCGKTVELWNVRTTKRIGSCDLPGYGSGPVAFSPDLTTVACETVASETEDRVASTTSRANAKNEDPKIVRTIRLVDLAMHKNTAIVSGHDYEISSLAFSPDGKTLASGSRDRTIKLWNLATGKCTTTFNGHEGNVDCVVFSPDSKTLASGSSDRTVRLWDVANGRNTAIIRRHTDKVRLVAFSPDGKILSSRSLDKTIRLWDLQMVKKADN